MSDESPEATLDLTDAARRTHRWGMRLLPLAAIASAAAGGLAAITGASPHGGAVLVGGIGVCLAWALAVFVLGDRVFVRDVPGALRLVNGALTLDGEVVATKGTFDTAGWRVDARTGRHVVDLGHTRRGEGVTLVVPAEADARAILNALALDPASAPLTRRYTGAHALSESLVRRGVAASLIGALVSIVAALGADTAYWAVPMMLGCACMLLVVFAPSRVTVGADGVLVTWLWLRRDCAFDVVSTVTLRPYGLALVRRDGTTFDIQLANAGTARSLAGQRFVSDERGMLAGRIAEVMRLRSAPPPTVVAPSARARGADDDELAAAPDQAPATAASERRR